MAHATASVNFTDRSSRCGPHASAGVDDAHALFQPRANRHSTRSGRTAAEDYDVIVALHISNVRLWHDDRSCLQWTVDVSKCTQCQADFYSQRRRIELAFFSFPPKLHRVKVFLCTGPKGPNLQTHKHVRIARVQVNQSCLFTRTNYMAACCCPVVVAAAAAPAAANCDLPRTIATRSCIARFTSRFEYHEHPHARTPAIRKSHAMPCHAMPCHPPPLSHSSRQPTNRPHNNNAAFGNCSLPATTERTTM